MSILDRIKSAFAAPAPVPPNTSRETIPPARPSELIARFTAESGRAELVRRAREMYARDPRIQGMIRTLARDATKNGFTITVENGDARAQEAADDLVKRLRLKRKLDDWLRMAARDGDLFLEVGVAADRRIVEVTRKPTLQMARLSDEFDRFADPARAFAWADAAAVASGTIDEKAVFFPEFLILHARWQHDTEQRYGQPEFAAAVGAWKKTTEGELDLAVGRKTRSGVRYVHNLVGASQADIEAYKATNRQALDTPFPAKADLFINFEGGVDTLQGDNNLGEIRDIEHHLQTMTAASPVPLELTAYGANLNRDVLQEKKAQYDEGIAAAQGWLSDQIIEPLLEREWLLAGILPETVEYSIGWPAKRVLAAADLQALAAAVDTMRRGGWSDEAIWALIEHHLPDDMALEMLFDGAPEPAPEPALAGQPADAPDEPDEPDEPDDDADDVAEAAVPARLYAETMGAVQRLIGRLEMATEGTGDGR
jgi:hypothetical protein